MTSESAASPRPDDPSPPAPAAAPPPPPDGTVPDPGLATQPAATVSPGPAGTPADFMRIIDQARGQPPPVAPAAPAGMERPVAGQPLVFHGDAREYFRIWIVNTLLTLLTLGLYAAWAKVRKRRYLRGSTELLGHRFDYVADPKRILVGNLLVALMFVAYMVVGEVYPTVRLGALMVGLVLLPWVVIRSLAFNAHNTVYRGMRFYFRRTYGGAALTYLGQWFAIILTLGLYYPAWVRNRKQFAIEGHRLGDAFFRFNSPAGPFYAAYLISGCMMIGASMIGGGITFLITLANGGKVPTQLQLVPFFLLYGFALFCSKQYVFARLFNHIWSHTRLDEHRFTANLSVGHWFKLQLVNLAAIVGSCGLLYPWAAVRSARYALSCLSFVPAGPVERISRLSRNTGSAVGETAAEFVGLEIGL